MLLQVCVQPDDAKPRVFMQGYSAVWPHLIQKDPDEMLKLRYRQRIQLGRYARQAVTIWDDMDLDEFFMYLDALVAVLGDEKAKNPTSTVEDI